VTSCSSIASYIDKIPSVSSPKPDSVFTSHYLELQRGTVRYIRTGNTKSKITVVLMPDPPNTIEHMQELIKMLEPTFQVIAFEAIGFGYSTASLSYDFSVQHNADVIIQLLEKLDVKQAILALTCVAALPGLVVAKRHPEKVIGLVLGQTPALDEARAWAKRVDFKGVLATPFIGQILLRLLRNKISGLWYKNALAKGMNSHSYLDKTLKSFRRGARFSLASAFQALLCDKTGPTEFVVEQNAIILWGNLDRSHKHTNNRSILNLVPNGKIIELENCAHFPDIEAPAEFASAIFSIAEGNR